ncbi:MAG: ion transporter [Bacteroidaceae bacterium]|nr:ion transporter [Bacteroidaceae bacterium]
MIKILEKINVVIEPYKDDKISRIYDWIMLVAIFIGVFPLMFRTQCKLFWFFDILSCLCFVADYILRWITCGVRSKRKTWLTYVIYPFTPMAIIDMLSILPTVTVLAPAFKIVRVSRLLKILRVVKVIRYFESLEMIIAVIRKQQRILCTVLSLSVFYIFITAIIMFNAEEDINPQTGDFLFHNFFDAFYWAACTLTTVGYGDLYPISNIGRIISVISSMVGIAIIALPSGVITAGYLDELRERKKTEVKEQQEK